MLKLRSYLDGLGVRYDWSKHDITYTAQDLAMREHISGERVVKPVLVHADGRFVLCALPATYYIDMDRLREELGANDARLADEGELERLFAGCELGAEPPIGRLFGIPTIVDDSLAAQDRITFQAGTHRDAVTMSFDDYQRIAQPRIGSFAEHWH